MKLRLMLDYYAQETNRKLLMPRLHLSLLSLHVSLLSLPLSLLSLHLNLLSLQLSSQPRIDVLLMLPPLFFQPGLQYFITILSCFQCKNAKTGWMNEK